jgi:hypothetical protein
MAEALKLDPDLFIEYALGAFQPGLAELVYHEAGVKDINMLFRIPDKTREKEWMRVIETVLQSLDQQAGDRAHTCRSYFLKNGKMVFGWNISLYPADYEKLIYKIGTALGTAVADKKDDPEDEPEPQEEPPSSPKSAPATVRPRDSAPPPRGALKGRAAPVRQGDTPKGERGRQVDSIPLSGRGAGFNPDTGRGVRLSGNGEYHPLKTQRAGRR